jgi:chemotaxis family two-component system response regulator Rcp1
MDILVIDDDGDDRDIFCETLCEVLPQANCIVMDSGEAAITYLRQPDNIPQYIFLDIHMRGMDGKECLLKIKSIKNLFKVPTIMYSAVDDPNEKVIYKKLGATAFINKTPDLNGLKQDLKTVLKI